MKKFIICILGCQLKPNGRDHPKFRDKPLMGGTDAAP
jgi:hypothetical protein